MNRKVTKQVAHDVQRYNTRCASCGREIFHGKRGISWTVDHFLPIAIAKWAPVADETIDAQQLANELSKMDNIVGMCPTCNFRKGSAIVMPHTLHRYKYLTDRQRKGFEVCYRKLKNEIKIYKELVADILSSQNNKCYLCGKDIPTEEGNLRRHNNQIERSRDNVVCLCCTCSSKVRNIPRERMTVDVLNKHIITQE